MNILTVIPIKRLRDQRPAESLPPYGVPHLARYPGHYSQAFAFFSILFQPAISMPCG